MYDDKTSESYLILAAYQEICPMEVYVLTPSSCLVKLPVNIVFAFPVHFIVLEVECFRQTNKLPSTGSGFFSRSYRVSPGGL